MDSLFQGDVAVSLRGGLVRVVEQKLSAGMVFLIVRDVGRTDADADTWVPLSAWREHLQPLPTAEAAEAWRAAMTRPLVPPPASGEAAVERRRRTLDYRVPARQARALHESYAAPGRPEAAEHAVIAQLEQRVLPPFARVLGTSVEALAAELRAAHPRFAVGAVAAVTAALVLPPCPDAEPIGAVQLDGEARSGDHGDVRLQLESGTWFGYVRQAPRAGGDILIAVHADRAGEVAALIDEATELGVAGTDCARATLYDATLPDDEQGFAELNDPVEPGILAGRGFAANLGGDGDYVVRGAVRGSVCVCVVAGESLPDDA